MRNVGEAATRQQQTYRCWRLRLRFPRPASPPAPPVALTNINDEAGRGEEAAVHGDVTAQRGMGRGSREAKQVLRETGQKRTSACHTFINGDPPDPIRATQVKIRSQIKSQPPDLQARKRSTRGTQFGRADACRFTCALRARVSRTQPKDDPAPTATLCGQLPAYAPVRLCY